jgi:hypothetical protein
VQDKRTRKAYWIASTELDAKFTLGIYGMVADDIPDTRNE